MHEAIDLNYIVSGSASLCSELTHYNYSKCDDAIPQVVHIYPPKQAIRVANLCFLS